MISGVVLVLCGDALVPPSRPHAEWAAAFLLVNVLDIPALEEPMLEARFGDSWREYRRNVPRFLPRLRPWTSPPLA
jgi:protein-S-isoprenylcysteine O-methyltransferase Ste14